MTTRGTDIAVVIPVLRDAAALRALLTRIRGWSEQPAEIRVVAGAPSADIANACRELDCDLEVSSPCRGGQLDVGARATTSGTIWFLHADAEPPTTGLRAIVAAQAAGAESGCFRFAFAGTPQLRKRIIARGVAIRVCLGGIPYGDQGLWMTRAAYVEAGGFAHEPLFEEARLVKRLRKRGTFVVLDEPIGVAPRRYERDGWLRRCMANRALALGHACGIPPTRLAARYDRPRLIEDPPQ